MKKLMHIVATPRSIESRTLKVAGAFLDTFRERYPDCVIDELNVATAQLPSLTVPIVTGKYVLLSGKELSAELVDAWKVITRNIERFLSADVYLISTPMWNFSVPYSLKHYIDIIVQPKYLFRYTEAGVEGLAKNKKMVVIMSRGGDYAPQTAMQRYDFQEPYLRAIFSFVGITDITFITAQPMDMGSKIMQKKLAEAIAKAQEIAKDF